jgi:glycosyl transferase family 10 (putative fucosyltransferase)
MARPPLHRKARILSEWTRSRMLQRGLLPPKRPPADRQIILFYNGRFGWPDLSPPAPPSGFELSTDLRLFNDARAVIFHIPSLGNIDHLEKPEGQLWIARWKECEAHARFSRAADREFMSRFDLTLSHRLNADVLNGYFNLRLYEDGESQLRAEPRPKQGLAAIFMSGKLDVSGRTGYLSELMKHMPVSSYGRVLRNQRLRPDRGRPTLLETIGRFKFTLAFENAIGEDYVTEKFYDPLYAGSVPVYLGAPNVDRLAPAKDCYIDVNDFSGPRELAERLLQLDADDEAYGEYFDWKQRPFQPEFRSLIDLQTKEPLERVFELIADQPRSTPTAEERPALPSLQ